MSEFNESHRFTLRRMLSAAKKRKKKKEKRNILVVHCDAHAIITKS